MANKLTILQIVTRRQYRGAEMFASKLSEGLVGQGHRVIFLGLYPPPPVDLQPQGAECQDLNGDSSAFISPKLLKELKQFIAEYKPDIIQANGSDTLKYSALCKRHFPQIPLIYRLISMPSYWMGTNPFKRMVYRFFYSKTNFVSGVGRPAIDQLVELMNYPPAKTNVIYRGVDEHLFDKDSCRQTLGAELNIPQTAKVLITVGALKDEKDHHFMIDAFAQMNHHDKELHLILLGEGDLKMDLMAKCKSIGFGNKVHFVGFKDNVGEWLAGADLFLLTSKIEGVPGVVLEAAIQKLPALAIDVGGVREVIEHKITGIALPEREVKSFAFKADYLLSQPALLAEMGTNSRQLVVNKFGLSRAVREFEELYLQLLN
ncbi:glycosyltransferase [Fulvivirgaceae bacterium LMO-SS25]